MDDLGGALVIMVKEKASSISITPLATIKSYAAAGFDPTIMGLGPVYATREALEKIGLSVKNKDIIERNEAFAAQVLSIFEEIPGFKENEGRVNHNRGRSHLVTQSLRQVA